MYRLAISVTGEHLECARKERDRGGDGGSRHTELPRQAVQRTLWWKCGRSWGPLLRFPSLWPESAYYAVAIPSTRGAHASCVRLEIYSMAHGYRSPAKRTV